MSPVGFLLIAVVIGVAGSIIVVLRNRQDGHPDRAMDEFRREMDALAPPPMQLDQPETRTRIPFRPGELADPVGESGNDDSSRDE